VSGPSIGVAVIGAGMAGRAHAAAYRAAGMVDGPELPDVRLVAVADLNARQAVIAARRFGYLRAERDWESVAVAPDIDVVSVVVANHLHREIVEGLLAEGKHVLCEKPLANTVAEAESMAAAARSAPGQQAMVGFSYRRTPAVALARQMVADGAIGTVRQVRAQYLQDWLADEKSPLTWRLDKERAGSGALGDVGAHIVDAVEFVTGQQVAGVSGLLETFVKQRPMPGERAAGTSIGGTAGVGYGPVTVDDAAVFFGRTEGGALATFEATRFATGRKNGMGIEVNGSAGSFFFDFESMNELHVYDGTVPARDAGFRRILVTEPDHPYLSGWWPPGHVLGYEHTFTHEVADFLSDIGSDRDPSPSFREGLQVQRVLDAVERSSAAESRWTPIPTS